jgi:hypothetical protein
VAYRDSGCSREHFASITLVQSNLRPVRWLTVGERRCGAEDFRIVIDSEDGWKTLTIANDWVKVADTKAGVVLTACGVLAGVVLTSLPAHDAWSRSPWHVALLLTSLGFVCVSIVLALRVFVPRLSPGVSAGSDGELLHFDTVARRFPDQEKYVAEYRTLLADAERLSRALAEQTWAVSVVARRKYANVTPAIWFLVAGLLVAVLGGLLRA